MNNFIFHQSLQEKNLSALSFPSRLKRNAVFAGTITKIHKKTLDVEFSPFHIQHQFSSIQCQGSRESFFFGKHFLCVGDKFSFSFKGINSFFQELEYSKKKEKLNNLVKYAPKFFCRRSVLDIKKKKFFFRSRSLSLKKSIEKTSFYGSQAFLYKSLKFQKRLKKKIKPLYRFFKASPAFGQLKNFFLTKWKISTISTRKNQANKRIFYYGRNQYFRSFPIVRNIYLKK